MSTTSGDYGQWFQPINDRTCQCPAYWWGTVPPYCPVHNPGPTSAWTWPTGTAPPLSDADVERIAQRVAELVTPKRKRKARK